MLNILPYMQARVVLIIARAGFSDRPFISLILKLLGVGGIKVWGQKEAATVLPAD